MSVEQEKKLKKLSPQEAQGRLEGFFEGKIDEIHEEIREAEGWPTSVKLGPEIVRREQAIKSLQRLISELDHVQQFVMKTLRDLHPELKDEN